MNPALTLFNMNTAPGGHSCFGGFFGVAFHPNTLATNATFRYPRYPANHECTCLTTHRINDTDIDHYVLVLTQTDHEHDHKGRRMPLLERGVRLVLFAGDGRVTDGADDAQGEARHGEEHPPHSSWGERRRRMR